MDKPRAVEDLDVFKRAYRVSLEVHRSSLNFPPIEQYALGDQVRRASKGICANLAEGFGRQAASKAEFKRFVMMAMGSADEMRVWSRYCLDWVTSTRPHGRRGARSIARSPRCCRRCTGTPGRSGAASDLRSLTSDL